MTIWKRKDIPIPLLDLPGVKGCRKHHVHVYVQQPGKVTIHASCWDGGSRTFTAAFEGIHKLPNVEGVYYSEAWRGVALPTAGGYSEGFRPASYDLPDGVVIVETGTFRGKNASPSIRMTVATAAKYGLEESA